MMRGKIIKKRTKNRETLLRNLRKGKARLEPRCQYETIPFPVKFASKPQVFHLYADLILMEYQNTLTIEASLFNNVKLYKHAQVTTEWSNQKIVRVFTENKYGVPMNCELIADKLEEREEMQCWAASIRAYCQRYEQLLEKLKAKKEEVSSEILQSYNQMNDRTEKTRQNLFRTYPCVELKSELKDGQIQLTEFIFNQKYLAELGYSVDSFLTHLFQEGLPMMIPFEGASGQTFVKMRLENYLMDIKDGFQSSETESSLIVKGNYIKKVKFRHHYYSTYEKGIPGFSIFATIIAKQKPVLDFSKSQKLKVNNDFIDFMAQREDAVGSFLSTYYDEKADQNYTNLDKICKIREIRNQEEI